MKFKLPLPSFFARYATCLVASAGLLLSACGGGGTGPDASAGAPAIHRLQITTSVSPSVTVVAVTKLSETRVSRTVYDYVFKITVQNGPQSLSSLKAKLVAVGSGTTILDGDVDVGGIGADAQATPADTIKLRHDRALPFDQAAFRWEFTASSSVAWTSLTPRIAETGTGNPVTVSFQEEATLASSTPLSWQFTKLPDGASAPAVTPSNNGLRVVFTPTVHGTYELRATDGVDAISVWVSTYAKPGFDEAAVQPSIPGSDWRTVGGVITNQYVLTTTLTPSALAQVFTKYPTLLYLGQTSRLFHELRLSEITPRSQAEVAALGFEAGITVIGQATLSRMTLSSVEGCRTTLTAEACDGAAFDGQGGNWHITESKIDKAWQLLGSTGSPDVYIGVVDGGFYFEHEDLKWLQGGNSIAQRVRYGLNRYIYADTSEDSIKSISHGTGTLGILGAQLGNGFGITGINGAATFVTSTYVTELPNIETPGIVTGRDTALISQLDDVANFNDKVRLINNSWGPTWTSNDKNFPESFVNLRKTRALYRDNILSSVLSRDKLFVFAAGNGLDNVGPGLDAVFDWGAMYYGNPNDADSTEACRLHENPLECAGQIVVPLDNVLLVAAYRKKNSFQKNRLAYYSNFGNSVEIAAPTDFDAPKAKVVPVVGQQLAYVFSGAYFGRASAKSFNGTSAAAPVVSGVASLVYAVDQNFTASDVKKIIIKSAQRGGRFITHRECASDGANTCTDIILDTPIPVLDAEEAVKLANEVSGGREVFVSSQLADFTSGKVLIKLKAGKADLVSATGNIASYSGPWNAATFSSALTLEPGLANVLSAPLAVQGGTVLYIASGTATFRNSTTGIVTANAKPFSLVFDAQTIDVEVKNIATANALAGAQVTFQCDSVTQSCPPAATVGSNAAGLARFYAPSGKYRVTVKQSGYQDTVLKVTVAQANDRSATINPNNIQTVKVALSSTASPETGALTGLISTPSGAPAVGATVTVTGGGFSRSATTDSQGRYAVSGVRVATDGGQAIYDHQVQVVALGYQIATGAIPVLGKKVQPFNARLVALTCTGSQVPGYGACVSPVQTPWCGQTVRFDNNQLPTGWTSHLVRGGPGVINNRLEARPTDSGATVESPTAAMPAGVSSVVVEFDNTQTLSFYGQFNIIEFKTALGKYWTFGDVHATLRIGDGNREFSTYLNSQPFWNQLASTAELRKVQTVALGLGNFKSRLTLRNGMSEWALVDNATGTVTNVSQTPDASFVLSDLVGFNASVYTTTGGTATMDNISIQCLR